MALLGAAENVPPRPVYQKPVQRGLDCREFRGHVLPQRVFVPQLLRLDVPHDALDLVHELIELVAAADTQVPKMSKELGQILDGRVSKHLRLAVRWLTSLASSLTNASSASWMASLNRAETR